MEYSKEIADEVLDRIAEGQMLTKICASEHMPDRLTFYRWMVARPDLANAYVRARLLWADWWAEKVLALSMDGSGDIYLDEGGKPVVDHANVQRARLQADTIKWLVGKYAPRVYGDKPAPEDIPAQQQIARIERVIIAPPGDEARRLVGHPNDGLSQDDRAILGDIVELVRRTVPRAGDRPPGQVLSVIRKALRENFG